MGIDARHNPQAKDYTGTSGTLDARGRILQEGDEVILAIAGPIYFRVASIVPVLDPGAPPGLLHVHLGCITTFTAKRDAVNREFIRVRTAEEAGPSVFKLLDAQPAPAGPIGIVDGPDPRD